MSRSGYSDDCSGTELNLWRGAVESSIRGKRGQALLHETLAVLEAMPIKKLIAHEFVQEGEYCTLGVLAQARGVNLGKLDGYERETVAQAFGIAPALAAEIMFLNDESIYDFDWVPYELCGPIRPFEHHTRSVRSPISNAPERRWKYMRDWVAMNIAKPASI